MSFDDYREEKVSILKFVSFVAALITIGNFVLAISNSFKLPILYIPEIEFAELATNIRISVTLILELSLASFFGYSMCKSIKVLNTHAAPSFVLVFLISIISAWVSFFNIEYVLLGGAILKGFWELLGLFLLLSLAYGIGAFFIFIHHMDLKCNKVVTFQNPRVLYLIQGIAFILLYIGVLI